VTHLALIKITQHFDSANHYRLLPKSLFLVVIIVNRPFYCVCVLYYDKNDSLP